MLFRSAFAGFGNVARALTHILCDRELELDREYSLQCKTTAIATGGHGCIISKDGIDLLEAAALVERGGELGKLPRSIGVHDPLKLIENCDADVLLETTSLNVIDGEPAVTYIRTALARGIHVITTNKGPIAFRLP